MVLQAMSSESDAELMCDVRTSTQARSVVQGGVRSAEDDQGVSSDSTDSF